MSLRSNSSSICLNFSKIILFIKKFSLETNRQMSRDPDSHPLFTSNVEETRKLDNVLVEGMKALEKDDTPDEVL